MLEFQEQEVPLVRGQCEYYGWPCCKSLPLLCRQAVYLAQRATWSAVMDATGFQEEEEVIQDRKTDLDFESGAMASGYTDNVDVVGMGRDRLNQLTTDICNTLIQRVY